MSLCVLGFPTSPARHPERSEAESKDELGSSEGAVRMASAPVLTVPFQCNIFQMYRSRALVKMPFPCI